MHITLGLLLLLRALLSYCMLLLRVLPLLVPMT